MKAMIIIKIISLTVTKIIIISLRWK